MYSLLAYAEQAVSVQASSKKAIEAEDALQRQLAKKLGIKGKKRKVAPVEEADAEETFAGPHTYFQCQAKLVPDNADYTLLSAGTDHVY